jgi:hypothetical protein
MPKTTEERRAESIADRENTIIGEAQGQRWIIETLPSYNDCEAELKSIVADQEYALKIGDRNRRSRNRGRARIINRYVESIIEDKQRELAIEHLRAGR